jgi:hypothetical protein
MAVQDCNPLAGFSPRGREEQLLSLKPSGMSSELLVMECQEDITRARWTSSVRSGGVSVGQGVQTWPTASLVEPFSVA